MREDASPEAEAPAESGEAARRDCQNCGAPLYGRYCHECGQRVDDRIVPVRKLVSEAVEDVLELDVRLLRTLRKLLRPGALTNAYLGGRRAGYVPPLRLLLIAGFIFLLAVGLGQRFRPSDAGGLVIQFDDDKEAQLVQKRDSLRQAESTWLRLRADVIDSVLRGHRESERLNRLFVERLSLVAVLLLPIFALILRGLYRRRLYTEHAIFALHLHAVLFGVVGLAMLLGLGAVVLGLPTTVLKVGFSGVVLGLFAYVWTALYRVYDSGVVVTTLKLVALLIAYFFAFVGVFVLYAGLTVLLV